MMMKEAIDQGINSLNEGKGMAHQEVISQLKQKYPTLKFTKTSYIPSL